MSSPILPSVLHVAHGQQQASQSLPLCDQPASSLSDAVHLFGQTCVLAAFLFGLKGLR